MNKAETVKLDMIEGSTSRGIRLTFYPTNETGFVMSAEAADRATYDQFAQDTEAQGKAGLSVSHEYRLASGNILLLVDVTVV